MRYNALCRLHSLATVQLFDWKQTCGVSQCLTKKCSPFILLLFIFVHQSLMTTLCSLKLRLQRQSEILRDIYNLLFFFSFHLFIPDSLVTVLFLRRHIIEISFVHLVPIDCNFLTVWIVTQILPKGDCCFLSFVHPVSRKRANLGISFRIWCQSEVLLKAFFHFCTSCVQPRL